MSRQVPFVSVIIPVYGEISILRQTLEALHEQNYPQGSYQVLVVDNGAFTDLGEIVKLYPEVSLYHEIRPGSYRARNCGLKYAKGDIIAFTDSDCIPYPDWIDRGVHAIKTSSEIGLVAGKIEVSFKNTHRPTAREVYDSLVSFPQELFLKRYRYAVTANLFTTRQVIGKVGSFDPALLSGGDCDWGRRVFECGFAQKYTASAIVRHPARKSMGSLISKSRRVTIGTLYCLKNMDGKTFSARYFYHHLIQRPGKIWAQMLTFPLSLGVIMRCKVLIIYYVLKIIQVAERVRVVALGGSPRR